MNTGFFGFGGFTDRASGVLRPLLQRLIAIKRGTNANVQIHTIEADAPEYSRVDLAIIPQGDGALLRTIPDNTVAGGNQRGKGANDFQSVRSAATQVASGNYSCIGGGTNNTASGDYSFAFGSGASASGLYSVAIGDSATASGIGSVVLGGSSSAASGDYSIAIGPFANTKSIYGRMCIGMGIQNSNYVFQTLRGTTTNSTSVVLTSDGLSASSINQLQLGNTSTMAFSILVSARRTDANDESAGYLITGVVDRQATASTTALVGTPTVTVLGEDTAAWDVSVSADTTNGALSVNVTGENSKTIYWVASVEASELFYS